MSAICYSVRGKMLCLMLNLNDFNHLDINFVSENFKKNLRNYLEVKN